MSGCDQATDRHSGEAPPEGRCSITGKDGASFSCTLRGKHKFSASPLWQEAEVTGTGCDDLQIKIYSEKVFTQDELRRGDLPGRRRLSVWDFAYCMPHLDNVYEHLNSKPIHHVDGYEIEFMDGFTLFGRPEPRESPEMPRHVQEWYDTHVPPDARKLRQAFYKVRDIIDCPETGADFCATIDMYKHKYIRTRRYMIYCWDCETLRQSPEKLQDAIVFSPNSTSELALDGGFATPTERSGIAKRLNEFMQDYTKED